MYPIVSRLLCSLILITSFVLPSFSYASADFKQAQKDLYEEFALEVQEDNLNVVALEKKIHRRLTRQFDRISKQILKMNVNEAEKLLAKIQNRNENDYSSHDSSAKEKLKMFFNEKSLEKTKDATSAAINEYCKEIKSASKCLKEIKAVHELNQKTVKIKHEASRMPASEVSTAQLILGILLIAGGVVLIIITPMAFIGALLMIGVGLWTSGIVSDEG